MKHFALIVLLLAACSSPPPTKPVIGMSEWSFKNVCSPFTDDYHVLQTAQGETRTIKNNRIDRTNDSERPVECVGTFTFVNDKLTSIAR